MVNVLRQKRACQGAAIFAAGRYILGKSSALSRPQHSHFEPFLIVAARSIGWLGDSAGERKLSVAIAPPAQTIAKPSLAAGGG
jgi:hypothetical protein